ncbi:hypothetical protein HS041_33780 [Planomonospora sp. ID67723]|uniref:hypothetical protein n=1 Tax=Planomonospora sp. ID67723 TaxID=2738134 RepID=UPI0018C3ED12|nr:hypothetical protein [Planomonospora sp. ID67723]MBG0832671.1 hypothetical protein [Planomonospora sp. ID67723]
MSRLIDRMIDRIVPKARVSACSSGYFCNAAGHPGYWWRYCCPQFGCQWSYVGTC